LHFGVRVGLRRRLLCWWIGVNLSSRSVHSPYPSDCSYSLPGTRVGGDRLEARSESIPGIWRTQVPVTAWQLRGCRPCLQRDGLRVIAPAEWTGEVKEPFALTVATHHEQWTLLGSPLTACKL
jgi:hypothetical protein